MKIEFEKTSCGRCGGGGKYSFNLMHGDRCYGCGGSGLALTKRGKAARAKLLELQQRPVPDLKVGEFVWYDPYPMGGKAKWQRIISMRMDTLNVDSVIVEIVPCRWHMHATQNVRSVVDQASLDAIVTEVHAYQASLGVNGKPLKKAKVAA
jgi:hypothetical protein